MNRLFAALYDLHYWTCQRLYSPEIGRLVPAVARYRPPSFHLLMVLHPKRVRLLTRLPWRSSSAACGLLLWRTRRGSTSTTATTRVRSREVACGGGGGA